MFNVLKAATMSAAILVASPSLAVNLITNGSFESGIANIGNFATLSAGDTTSITGWTVGGAGVDYIGSLWNASQGVRSIDLSALNAGSLSQTFNTVLNQKYLVTFDLSGNSDGNAPLLKTLLVSPGANIFTYDRAVEMNTSTNMKYKSLSFQFVGTGTPTTLTFASGTAASGGPVLDNVAVDAVPEPLTWGMMVVGFGAMGAAMRRRRPVALNA